MQMNAAIAAAILAFTSSALAYYPTEYDSLYARDAYVDAKEHDLWTRDAFAEPDEEFDLYAREAEAEADALPEAYADYDELDLYERDVDDLDLRAREADEALEIHPRDAYLEGYKHGLFARSLDTLADLELEPRDALPDDLDDLASKSDKLEKQKASQEKLMSKDKVDLEKMLEKTRKQEKELKKTAKDESDTDKEG